MSGLASPHGPARLEVNNHRRTFVHTYVCTHDFMLATHLMGVPGLRGLRSYPRCLQQECTRGCHNTSLHLRVQLLKSFQLQEHHMEWS